MIEVLIRGPLARKDYVRIKKLLETAGDGVRTEKRIVVDYSREPYESRTIAISLKQKNDVPVVVVKTGKSSDFVVREEHEVALQKGEFTNAVKLFASLGYMKALVCVRESFHARYGGAEFKLVDPGEDLFYYEAEMLVKTGSEATEAKQKLEVLARNLKLPVFGQGEMLTFINALDKRASYVYDYAEQGAEHFREKFGI